VRRTADLARRHTPTHDHPATTPSRRTVALTAVATWSDQSKACEDGAMDQRLPQRVAENEALAREVNEAIERGQWPGEQGTDSAFRCECAVEDCNRLIELTPREYERVRADPRQFVVAPGHEQPKFETVVQAEAGYFVVRKRGEAGVQAQETDPRG
jgi:hypothetical protein